MNILVVGGGGREHALAWRLSNSRRRRRILCAPGNPGISSVAECLPIQPDDLEGLLSVAKERQVDLTVVGPELPLSMGIVDRFQAEGLEIFGPSQGAARIESSKAFAKQFMVEHGIPTAQAESFSDPAAAIRYVRSRSGPIVVKADGLAAGKGVVIAQTQSEAEQSIEQMMKRRVFGAAGERIVIEEFLVGEEATLLAFCAGTDAVLMPASQDHKRIGDGDRGANTGGMGAYAPAPVVSDEIRERVLREVIQPTLQGLSRAGSPYRGVLYIGLMIGPEGPKVLEYNCRFGDPEAQVILPLLENDLADLLLDAAQGRLDPKAVRWRPMAALCVVLAASGYPGPYRKGDPIRGLEKLDPMPGVFVFHAGTAMERGGIVTAGGRVLGVTALEKNLTEARDLAYQAVDRIRFDGMQFRRDIGGRALDRQGIG